MFFAAVLLLQLFLLAGCSASTPRQVSSSGKGAYEASLASTADGFVAAWYDTRSGQAEVYARVLNEDGSARSSELRLTHGDAAAYEADVDLLQENLVVAWYERSEGGGLQAKLGMWTTRGELLWSHAVSAAGRNGRNTLVRVHHRELFCAWIEDDDGANTEVWAGWYGSDGQPLLPAFRVGPASTTTWNLNAAIRSDGDALVVFDASAGTRSNELFVSHVDRAGSSEVQRLTSDDGVPSKYPDIAVGDGRLALTWFDERDGNKEVYFFTTAAEGLEELEGTKAEAGVERTARRVTQTPGESIGAYVSWNGRRFGLAWCDNTVGQHELYFQAFEKDGLPAGQTRRLTFTQTQSSIPAIRPRGDGFALAWNEYTPSASAHGGDARSEIHFMSVP